MDSIRIYMGLAKIWKSNGKNWDDFKVKKPEKCELYNDGHQKMTRTYENEEHRKLNWTHQHTEVSNIHLA